MTQPEPYGTPEKPSLLVRLTNALGMTNLLLAGLFVVIGVGALLVALVTGERVTAIVGAAAIVMGVVRLLPRLIARR